MIATLFMDTLWGPFAWVGDGASLLEIVMAWCIAASLLLGMLSFALRQHPHTLLISGCSIALWIFLGLLGVGIDV
jgi:hypothetical protein